MIAPLGYETCACGEFVVKEIAIVTGGRCNPCWSRYTERIKHDVTVYIEGRHSGLAPASPHRARHKRRDRRRKADPRLRANLNARWRAGDRARRRLAALFPAEFAILMAIERDREGLEPWTANLAARAGLGALDEATLEGAMQALEARVAYHVGSDGREDMDQAHSEAFGSPPDRADGRSGSPEPVED